ncbi:zinc-ribbon domain-containing protein [Halorarius halobius]|uniref:zinc-ribbon domain-containing protein n=1 Tax=Halorarius halobius TaxID=2962671 RepID=UPI0020CC1578|nr:zinc-ribbon domain-containing protein [Halorarius halobius]
MSVHGFVTSMFATGPRYVYECRDCGATLEAGATVCPYCGPTDVVEFDLQG